MMENDDYIIVDRKSQFSRAIDILYSAKQSGVEIALDEGQLQLSIAENKNFDESLLTEIRDNKQLIIDFLSKKNWRSQKVEKNYNKINKINRDSVQNIPLSFSQERLWFIDQLEGSVQYHIPEILRLKGKLNEGALNKALQTIVNRHEVLRTVIRNVDGKGYQYIKEKDKWELNIVIGQQFQQDKEGLQKYINTLIKKPFNLSVDDSLRAHLIKLSEQENILVVTLHHIASDGWSKSILVKEVAELYSSYDENRSENLETLDIQYADYALWQRDYLQGDSLEKKINYWKQKLNGVILLQIPTDFVRPAIQSNRGAILNFNIGNEVSEELQFLSRENGTTLFMTMLACLNVLLYRYSGQEDVCVGTPIAGRQQPEVENLIGFFINTLALRSTLNSNDSFENLLMQVRNTTMEAFSHQEIPFEKVVEAVVKERDLSHTPLFQVMLVLQNTQEINRLKLGELILLREDYKHTNTKFDLNFTITETSGGLKVTIQYCTDLYKAETIERMVNHFRQLLKSIVENPSGKISDLKMITLTEERLILEDFNNTSTEYPRDKNIIDLFEEQTKRTPENTAIIFDGEKITYRDLNNRSNQLARYLKTKGVKEEVPVPICIERRIEMITGILGILKAGGAYVPIDPEYPEDRIKYMLEDTAASVIVSNKASIIKLPESKAGVKVIEIDTDWEEISKEGGEDLQIKIEPSSLAYIIYTSGSTGRPKGVMIEHRNVYSFIRWCQQEFLLDRFKIVYASTSMCFDLSVFEFFYPLSIGKPIRLLENGLEIGKYLSKDKDVMTNSVPVVIESLLREGVNLDNITVMNMAGEPISSYVQQELDAEKIAIRNLYGPTEDTTYSTVYHLRNGKEVLIGKPISNTSVLIVNKEGDLVPIGIAGEICLSGEGLSRGYLNRKELTAEKFIPNNFCKKEGGRLYKTGDLGRWLPDGNIQYLGRIDNQVKIRGFRIELGEIEAVLLQSGLVKQAVVIARESREGVKRLAGYVVSEGKFDKEQLMSKIRVKLPEYMVPSLWVEMEILPLTPNGKIDKKALPEPDADDLQNKEYTEPRNETEKKIAEIWRELLGIKQVGIHDNFFELGGDSILTIQVVSRARRAGYELQPKDIFMHQSIVKLSTAISERLATIETGEQGFLKGDAKLLPIQQWYFEREPEDISHFNQSVLLKINKAITEHVLQETVEKLTKHHDALHFRYSKQKGVWNQEYGDRSTKIVVEDIKSGSNGQLAHLIKELSNKYQRSLDIEKGELIRVILIKAAEIETHNRLLIVIHHLAIDGVSWRILVGDMELLLSGIMSGEQVSLGYKSSSYRQWYEALEQYSQSEKLLSQKKYWQKVVGSYSPLVSDTNYNELILVKDTGQYSQRMEADQTRRLIQEVPRAYHTEINDILLCGLAKTLCDWNKTGKVTIGLEGHGREDIADGIDISHTVGWFTNLYPLLIEINQYENNNPGDLIKSVKEQLRQVPDKGLGYGVLKYINKENSLQTESQPWDIIFNYLGQVDTVVNESKWFSGAGESAGDSKSTKLIIDEKLSINSIIRGGELIINWTYSNRHYEEGTIKQLAANYILNLEKLINQCLQQQKIATVYTPSDYGLGSEISYLELDRFLDEKLSTDKIRRDQIDGLYQLSGLQQGMLFHSLYDSEAESYIIKFECTFLNPELEIFYQSWDAVLMSHSILRSAFYYDKFSIPVQCVYRDVKLPLVIIDYRNLSEEDQSLAISVFEKSERQRGFDFSEAPLMRITLIRLDENRYRMLWVYHHIILDGWSMPILMEAFLKTYESFSRGEKLTIKETDRYEDYIRYIESRDKKKDQLFWQNYLKNIESGTLIPFVNKTTKRTKGIGTYANSFLNIDRERTTQIRNFVQKNHLTANTLMQGVWSYLLHTYTGQKNVVFGVIVSGRPDDLTNVERRVGMYINTLPLHSNIQKNEKVGKWLSELQMEQVSLRQYQHTPLSDTKEWIGVKGDLFDSLLVFENYPVSKVMAAREWKLKVENVSVKEQTNYPLTLVIGVGDQINIRFSYNTELIDEAYINEIGNHFENVLIQLVENEENELNDIKILTSAEHEQLLYEFNETTIGYPDDKNIVDLFEEQVQRGPNNIAIVFNEEGITYKELNKRANQLAHCLQNQGVKQETLVPICVERNIDMIVGLLAILKAGGAYVPIDPEYPADRIIYMLENTGADLVVSSIYGRKKLSDSGIFSVLEVDGKDKEYISQQPGDNLQVMLQPSNLAYIIYTSGSTGQPKGVMIEHKNVVRLFETEKPLFDFNEKDVWTMFHSYCFDFSVWEMYGALLYGGRLVIVPSNVTKDTVLFADLLIKEKVTILNQTPSSFYVLQEIMIAKTNKSEIRYVIFGGEALSPAKLRPWKELYRDCRIINMYGITETTVHVTYQEIGWKQIENGNSIIGKTIPTLSAYILDEDQNLQPVGITGELCIGGAGLARGYLKREDLTAQKFIINPFSDNEDERLYKSGDLGRWLPDGTLEYLGRMDDQVKIRGFRIELGEIETAILQSGLINQVIVLATADKDGNNRLVSYIIAHNNFNKQAIISYLISKLPDYMIPYLWIKMDVFPLTSNGKIDRKALPDTDEEELLNNEYIPPRNELESCLVEIWKELLHRERIGILDNFFDLGGHSLLAIRLASAIRRKLKIELVINDIFINPTIAGLAEHFIERNKNPSSELLNIKYLVPLKNKGNKIPIYIVCGEAGTALKFKDFADLLDADQPVFALQPPINDSDLKDFPDTIEKIAGVFIKEILIRNPNGPYSLSGHCLGGFIAFEMSKQLREAGKEVHLLAMFDTVLRRSKKPKTASIKNLYLLPIIINNSIRKLLLKLNFEYFLFTKHTKQAIRYKLNSLRKPVDKIKRNGKFKVINVDHIELEHFEKSSIYSFACKNYKFTQNEEDIVLFYAKERYYFSDVEKKVAFKKLHLNDETKSTWRQFSKSITIYEINGEHSTMFEAENAQEFARILQQHLN